MTRPTLHSPRLALDPLTLDHLAAAHALWTEPGVRRFLWDDEIITAEQATDALRTSETSFDAHAFGLWGLYAIGSSELLGFCGLRLADVVPEPELLFGLTEAHWGRGLAAEAARAVLGYAFDDLRLTAVGAATDAGNVASARVLDRLGMRLVRRGEHHGLDTSWYRLTNADWTLSSGGERR
jgi:[ribosomal protein S5]-alanine N-acetyltransferase